MISSDIKFLSEQRRQKHSNRLYRLPNRSVPPNSRERQGKPPRKSAIRFQAYGPSPSGSKGRRSGSSQARHISPYWPEKTNNLRWEQDYLVFKRK